MKNFFDLKKIKLVDLTHTLLPGVPQWDRNCGFQKQTLLDYSDCKNKVKFRVQKLSMVSGIGTHIDAPMHCFENGKSVADIPLEDLISPCIIIDVAPKAHDQYKISIHDVKEFESQYGEIQENTFVIIHTGWAKYWSIPEKYRNNLCFPTLSKEAAQLLLERDILGIGVDTLSPDRAEEDFPIHDLVLSSGKYLIENIANADLLPAIGAYIIALPLKIQDGTEAPIRLIGLIQQ